MGIFKELIVIATSYMNLENTRRQAVESLTARRAEEIAECCGIPFDRAKKQFELNFLNGHYHITFPEGKVYSCQGVETPIYQSIIMLHYLITADGKALSGEWISFRQLPGGDIYTGPFRKRAIDPFLKAFGNRPDSFLAAAQALGGLRGSSSGINTIIPVLPRVPLSFILWTGDEEFPPSANILFDANASSYLPTEDYAHLPGFALQAMQSTLLP